MNNRSVMKLKTARVNTLVVSAFLLFTFSIVAYLIDAAISAFSHNIPINSVILFSILVGVSLIYKNIFLFDREYGKLLKYFNLSDADMRRLNVLRPLTFYITKNNKTISQAKLQTILGSVDKRINDQESFIRYISGILITFGLLGTFGGLASTIIGVSGIINTLGVAGGNAFEQLKGGLNTTLSGMGNAFGCSLFALGGAIILGFIFTREKKVSDELFNKIEEWISKNTISFDVIDNMQEYHGTIYSMGLLEKTIETIYAFQNNMRELDDNKASILSNQVEITKQIAKLTESIVDHKEILNMFGKYLSDVHKMISIMMGNNSADVANKVIENISAIDRRIQALIASNNNDKTFIVESLSKDIRMISKTLSVLMNES